jgi:hypothetical protein
MNGLGGNGEILFSPSNGNGNSAGPVVLRQMGPIFWPEAVGVTQTGEPGYPATGEVGARSISADPVMYLTNDFPSRIIRRVRHHHYEEGV